MDFSESTKVVYDRIQKLEPEKVSKIIGYLLLQGHGEREMIRLAFGPDTLIHSLINKAKSHLNLPSNSMSGMPIKFTPFSPGELQLHDQIEPANSSYFSPGMTSLPFKICHYFMKGCCKHGNKCRYSHGNIVPEIFSLEMELTQLLKSRKGFPVSIASLPMLYYEMFGKTLQAEGYLTESQRQGKSGYSLTKLLARLKRITLIDRPHGQHSVILADEVAKHVDYSGEQGSIVAGSRQIYLTFPAESSFTVQDVSNYFRKFGPVHDVRIPCQQKRMFGFVTFVFGETVKVILKRGNPHFVCGARVLVKPYREKSREDRIIRDKFRHIMYYGAHTLDAEPEHQSICDSSASLKKQLLIDEQLAAKPADQSTCFGHLFDDLNNPANDKRIRRINTRRNIDPVN